MTDFMKCLPCTRPLLDQLWSNVTVRNKSKKSFCPRTPCTLLSSVRPFDISFTWLDAKIDALTQRSLFFARNFQHLHFYTSLFSTLCKHGLQTPNGAFFHRNPKLLGLGRQFGQINFEAFGVFSAIGKKTKGQLISNLSFWCFQISKK